MKNLKAAQCLYFTYQEIWSHRQISLPQVLNEVVQNMNTSGLSCGLELDVDSIAYMPASAYTNCGIPIQDAEYYLYTLAQHTLIKYLHIAEGAPSRHPAGIKAGFKDVGQGLAHLVSSFLQGHHCSV